MATEQMHGVSLEAALEVTGVALQYGHGIGLFVFRVEKHGDTYVFEERVDSGEVNYREDNLTLADVKLHSAVNPFDHTEPDDWWPANADDEPLGWIIEPDGGWRWAVPEKVVSIEDYRN